MNYRWYDQSIGETLRILHTEGEEGLSKKEAAARLKEDGKNIINPVVRAPIRSYLVQVLSDLTTILLLAAALLSLLFKQDLSAIAMLVLLVVNYTVTILSYTHSQKVLEGLGKRSLPTTKVMRGGKLQVIPQENVVQGDVILLSSGDVVPCDMRLLDSENLRVMENNLFDLDEISPKDAAYLRAGIPAAGSSPNMLYATTVIVSGRARGVAVETGPDTLVCRMNKNQPIAACHKLDVIKDLKRISRVLGILMLVPVLLLTLFEMTGGRALADVFLGTLSVAVAAMPELYAAFAYVIVSCGMVSALKLDKKRKGAFIKNPPALPRLAQVDCLLLPMEALCCEGAVRLSEVFDGEKTVDLSSEQPDKEALRVLRYGLISTGLYGTERLALKHQLSENVYTVQQEALLEAGQRYEVYSKKLEEDYPIFDHLDKGEKGSLFETTLVHYKGHDVVVLRGDPEKVLDRCTGYYKEGKILPMDEGVRKELDALAAAFSRNNRQPVAVATKNHRYNSLLRIGEAQSDLIFEGFLAIEKPFLPDAAKEVLRMRDAGIRVLVYCKEEGAENRHLARALGIASGDSQMVRHSDLADMSEGIYKINLKNYTLFEGFDSMALGYTVSVLKEEYGYRVGVLGSDLSAVSLMYRADVFFANEDGDRMLSEKKEEQTVIDPVWAKTGNDTGRVGCQALGHLSDVIVPSVSMTGEGGINGVARALRVARSIYRNIGTLLFYLAFSGTMRIVASLFSLGGSFYLSPVQSLSLGLIFDLLAVFVIALHRPGVGYPKMDIFKGQAKLHSKIAKLFPAMAIGALLSSGILLFANALEQKGILSGEYRSAFVFCALLFSQSAMLALLRGELPFKRGKGIDPIHLCYLAAQLLWLLFCFLVPGVSSVTGIVFMGWQQLLLALSVPTVFFLISLLLHYLVQLREKRKKKSK